jgi:hypothetical protein
MLADYAATCLMLLGALNQPEHPSKVTLQFVKSRFAKSRWAVFLAAKYQLFNPRLTMELPIAMS